MRSNSFLSINLLAIFLILFIAGIANADGAFNFTINSPAGGEEWAIGSEQTIEFWHDNHHASDEDRVIVLLSTDGGDFEDAGEIACPNLPDGDQEVQWTVTGPPSETALLRCALHTSEAETWGGDTMTTPFTITGGVTLTLVSPDPAGGDDWSIGEEQIISWTDDYTGSSADDRVIISYRTDYSVEFQLIDSLQPIPDPKEYTWKVGGPSSATCEIKVELKTSNEYIFGSGLMEDGKYFIISPTGISYKPAIDNVTSFSILQQPAGALKMYDLNGRMVWETGNDVYSFKKLKNGAYLLIYDQSKQRIARKINLVR